MKVKEESEKVGLKLNIQKTKIMASGPITTWEIDGETVSDFIFWGSKITADGDYSHEIKRRLLLTSNLHIHTRLLKKNLLIKQTFVGKVMSLLFNMLSRLVIAFLPRSRRVLNFMALVTICSDFGAPKNSLTLFPHLFLMK